MGISVIKALVGLVSMTCDEGTLQWCGGELLVKMLLDADLRALVSDDLRRNDSVSSTTNTQH